MIRYKGGKVDRQAAIAHKPLVNEWADALDSATALLAQRDAEIARLRSVGMDEVDLRYEKVDEVARLRAALQGLFDARCNCAYTARATLAQRKARPEAWDRARAALGAQP